MHSVAAGNAPEYNSDLVTPVSELGRRVYLHLAAHGLYDIPRTRSLIGSKAFSVAGRMAWNKLPPSIRDISSIAAFKRHLKTHLVNCAFR